MRLYLDFFPEMSVLTILHDGHRTEFRGTSNIGAQPNVGDPVQEALDSLSGPAVSALMSGDVLTLPRPGRMSRDFAHMLCMLRIDDEFTVELRRKLRNGELSVEP